MILQKVKQYRMVLPNSSGKKLYPLLKREDTDGMMTGVGRDKFLGLLTENGLQVAMKRSYHKPGTDSSETKNPSVNLKKNLTINRVNQVLESDITCIKVRDLYYPLAICMDVYSRKILGWNLSRNWSTGEILKALQEAKPNNTADFRGCIHHSDRGSQYASKEYQEYCSKQEISQSMSRKATPTDAAHIERVNKTLKYEFNLRRRFHSFEEAEEEILWAIVRYNEFRPHWSLDLKTPSQVYEENRQART